MHVPYQQNFIHPVTQKLTIHLAYKKTLLPQSHKLCSLIDCFLCMVISILSNHISYLFGITSQVI